MPCIAHKCTAHCNRVQPCADLVASVRVGKGHSSKSNFGESARKSLRSSSPSDPLIPRHPIKVPVAAQQRERVLPAERCDPDVVGWNRFAFAL